MQLATAILAGMCVLAVSAETDVAAMDFKVNYNDEVATQLVTAAYGAEVTADVNATSLFSVQGAAIAVAGYYFFLGGHTQIDTMIDRCANPDTGA